MGAAMKALSVAVAMLASPIAAQTVDVRAGRLIDPMSERVLNDQRIRIVDGRIQSIAPWRESDGAASVDWSAKTVLPGLIDMHTHVADGSIDPKAANDPADPLKTSEAARILKAVPAART